MSEEKTVEIVKEKECNCFCKSEGFRNFLITALGTFVGVFLALSLFAALHKPPMPCPCHRFPHPPHMQMHGQFRGPDGMQRFDRKQFKNFKGEMKEGKALQKPEIND